MDSIRPFTWQPSDLLGVRDECFVAVKLLYKQVLGTYKMLYCTDHIV